MALKPRRPGPVHKGLLSRFDPMVRFAALRIKRQHRAWGPAVILDELGQRSSTCCLALPSVSQLAAYFHQFGNRLIQPRRNLQLPPPIEPASRLGEPLVFQLDMQERLHLNPIGYFNVLNIRAPQWGLTVGCYPHPAGEHRWQRKVSQQEARQDCRQTFERWGLCDVLQSDHDKVLVGTGEYPFPSLFTLWLVGLAVVHRLIQRVIQNGSVERTHRTFDKQMLSGVECETWTDFLEHVVSEQVRLNERLPSRAKACQGQVPIQAHPEARSPRRPYCQEREAELFDMQRVYRYLAGGRWIRHASEKGQFKFADHVWTVGQKQGSQPVVITFDLDTKEFVIQSAEGETLKRIASDWVTETAIRDLPEKEVVKVRIEDT